MTEIKCPKCGMSVGVSHGVVNDHGRVSSDLSAITCSGSGRDVSNLLIILGDWSR